jgi:hypothetical protein
MSFLRSSSCAADELLRRRVAGQVADLAEKYAPDITWFIKVMAEVSCQQTLGCKQAGAITASRHQGWLGKPDGTP